MDSLTSFDREDNPKSKTSTVGVGVGDSLPSAQPLPQQKPCPWRCVAVGVASA